MKIFYSSSLLFGKNNISPAWDPAKHQIGLAKSADVLRDGINSWSMGFILGAYGIEQPYCQFKFEDVKLNSKGSALKSSCILHNNHPILDLFFKAAQYRSNCS